MSQETIQIAKSISTEFATALKSQVSQLRDEFNSNLSLNAESIASIRRIVDEFESKWLAVDSQIGHQKTLMEAQKSIFDVEIKSLKGLINDVLSKSVNQIVDDLKSEFGEKLRINDGLHDEFTKKLSDNERANIDRVKTVIDSFEKKWANMDGAIADHAERFAKELTNIRKSIAESFNVDTVMNRILDEHGHLLKGAKGDEGEPGKSPNPAEVAKHILRDKTFADMVKPEPVDPVVVVDTLMKRHGEELKGDSGKDADPVDVVEVVGELMLKHGEAIRGKPGRDADEKLVAEKLMADQKFIGLVKEVIHSEPWTVGVYREGSVVKHFTGREYIAMQDTTEEPGDSTHWKRIGTHGLRDTGGYKADQQYEPGDFYHKDGSTFFFDGVNHRLFAAKPFTKAEFDKEFKRIQDTVIKYHELHADSQKSIGLIEDVLVQNKAVIEDQGQRIQSLEKDVVDLLLQPTEINDGSVPLRAYKGQYVEGNTYVRGDVITSHGVAYVKQSDGNGGLGDKTAWAKMTGGVSKSGGVSNGSLVQSFNSVSNLPPASQFGKGVAQVGSNLYVSDGIAWANSSAGSSSSSVFSDSRLYPLQSSALIIAGSDDYKGDYSFLYGRNTGTLLFKQDKTGVTTQLFDLATLKDRAGTLLSAIGTTSISLLRVLAANKDKVLILEVLCSGTNNRSFVYRSINGGLNWGSDSAATNLLPVLEEGIENWDGSTDTSKKNSYSLQTLRRVTLRGKDALIIGSYNIASALNNPIICKISTDSGITWETLFLTNALSRHMHVIEQDPYTGWLWFGFGDEGTAVKPGIIGWDGKSSWPSGNFTFDSLSGTSGFLVMYSPKSDTSQPDYDTRRKPLAFWFSQTHVYWSSDNSLTQIPSGDMGSRGIFRSSKTSDTTEKVSDVITARPYTAGGYGVTSKSGAFYLVDFPDNASETSTTRQVFASFDQGNTWREIGHWEHNTTITPLGNPLSIGAAGDHIWLSSGKGCAGSANVKQYSLVYEEAPGIAITPDQLAPVFWIDLTNGNGSDAIGSTPATSYGNGLNYGCHPNTPFLNLKYALLQCGNGFRMVVKDGTTQSPSAANSNTGVTPNFTSYSAGYNGVTGKRVQVTAKNRAEFAFDAATASYSLYPATTNNCPITYENLDFNSAAAVPLVESSTTVATSSDFVFDNCKLNGKKTLTANAVNARGTQIKFLRSQVYASGAGYIPLYIKSTAVPPIAYGSYIESNSTSKPILSERTVTPAAILENCIVRNVAGQSAFEGAAGAGKLYAKNCALIGNGSSHLIFHNTAVAYTNADVDYCALSHGSANATGTWNANGIAWSSNYFKLSTQGDFSSFLPANAITETKLYGDGYNQFDVLMSGLIGML